MGVDETSVDLLSLEEFRRRLVPHHQQADTAMAALVPPVTDPGAQPHDAQPHDAQPHDAPRPQLGAFQDAELTADGYEALRDEYLSRLRRLASALTAVETATTSVLAAYRTMEDLNAATTRGVAGLLSPLDEGPHDSHGSHGSRAHGDGHNSGG